GTPFGEGAVTISKAVHRPPNRGNSNLGRARRVDRTPQYADSREARECLLEEAKRFPSKSVLMDDTPVMFASGREKLTMSPVTTGSPAVANTMGIVWVATLAACADSTPPVVKMRSAGRWASSDRKSVV